MANNKITRKRGDFKDLEFTIDLTKYGKTNADIIDIFFTVKNTETEDDDYLLLKQETTGGITYTGTTVLAVNVKWAYNEYANFQVGKEYLVGLFPQFTGDAVADENATQTFLIKIEQDMLIQN